MTHVGWVKAFSKYVDYGIRGKGRSSSSITGTELLEKKMANDYLKSFGTERTNARSEAADCLAKMQEHFQGLDETVLSRASTENVKKTAAKGKRKNAKPQHSTVTVQYTLDCYVFVL